MSKKSNLSLYRVSLDKLLKKRAEIDAKIDFLLDVVSNTKFNLEVLVRDDFTGEVIERLI